MTESTVNVLQRCGITQVLKVLFMAAKNVRGGVGR